jgi:hypothetical protein
VNHSFRKEKKRKEKTHFYIKNRRQTIKKTKSNCNFASIDLSIKPDPKNNITITPTGYKKGT